MTVSGRVLDPDGTPIAKAPVNLVGRPRTPWVAAGERIGSYVLLGLGETGDDGRFRLNTSRTSSARFFEVYALVTAPGCGLGWAALNPDASQPLVEIPLRPAQDIRGKLVDLNGQPAAAVEIRVVQVRRPYTSGPIDGFSFWDGPPEGLQTWPAAVRTDDRGRFTLTGLGCGLEVSLDVRDARYARLGLHLPADDRAGPRDVTLSLRPSTIIEGRALAADTGLPMPHATIAVAAGQGEFGGMFTTRFRADDQGRFHAIPSPGDYFRVNAFPPEGQPYLVPQVEFAWSKGAIRKMIDIRLPRGILIRGKVTEEGSGLPLAGASVQYVPMKSAAGNTGGSKSIVASKDDGSFQIVVPAGKGHLLVFGPTPDYILEAVGDRTLSNGQPGGRRNYAHRIVAYEVSTEDRPHTIDATLRRGTSVRGKVVDPQGQTVQEARILSRLHIEHFSPHWRGDFERLARDGCFELNGLDPEKAVPVYFLDAVHQWGAAVEISGKHAREEVNVRLQPCGQAQARFVGPEGKPLASTDLTQLSHLEILVTPGRPALSLSDADQSRLAADAVPVAAIDRIHYANSPRTDAGGRITFPALIPGAAYRVSDSTVSTQGKGPQIRRDFTVKPGETLDLGDILIEKPSGS